MSSNDLIINDTIDMLRDSGVVPVDRIMTLTSMGINYKLLEDKYSVLN